MPALEQFFASIPDNCQLSYVVIMHIPPDGPSFLAETLGRLTAMTVVTAESSMALKPDNVYVIPAGRYLSVANGLLCLETPEGTREVRHPIDRFFESMAADLGERAVAVVLSGSGLDGGSGSRAVKERGGVVLVQDPTSAIKPSMPQNAIASGNADFVLAAEELPVRIAGLARGACPLPSQDCHTTTLEDELQAVFRIVRARTGHDFSSYKRNTVTRRIERRMAINEVATVKKYLDLLENNDGEAEALGQEILIGVTRFFRDEEAFGVLAKEIIPRLFAGRDPDDPVRIWHACCATGEEVYSAAMLIREYLDERKLDAKVQFFATDLDETAISVARAGVYERDVAGEVGQERIDRFFTRINGRWQVSKRLREMIVFAHHSLIKDAPFSRIDLLVCRNFLIYLNPDMQKRLISLFHLVLKPAAVLFLGASETVGTASDLFLPIDKKWKIYERRECARRDEQAFPITSAVRRVTGAAKTSRSSRAPQQAAGETADRLLAQLYAPPTVVVNSRYDVVHICAGANRFLDLPVGGATLELLKLAREELRPALRAAMFKSFSEKAPVTFRGLRMAAGGEETAVNVLVKPFLTALGEELALVVFEPAQSSAPVEAGGEERRHPDDETSRDLLVRQLEEQLRVTHEQLQATTEQLENSRDGFMSANEELMSINEEFQSANEELHSTNEELETSREELQALNEELVTVNAELQGKVEELDQASSDMENLLASSAIATLFLDRELNIKRFTPAAAEIFNLIPADIGRPFRHLAGTIDWHGLAADAATVLATSTSIEREVAAVASRRSYLMGVLPYRTADGGIDGIVVTLVDITDHKRLEEETVHLASFPELNPNPVLEADLSGQVTFANPATIRILEALGMGDDFAPFVPDDLAAIVERWDRLGDAVHYREVTLKEQVFGETIFLSRQFNLARIYAFELTDLKKTEEAIRRGKEEWERTFDSVPDLIAIMDGQHRIVRVNRAMAQRLGTSPKECIGQVCYRSVHGTEHPPCDCPHTRSLLDGREHQGEIYEERLGGHFLVSTTPLFNKEGVMTGTVHVARDITERKRTEEAHARLAAIVASSDDAIIAKDLDGTILTWNGGAERMFGYRAGEMVGRPISLLIPRELQVEEESILKRLLAGEAVDHFESRRLARDGRAIDVSLTVSPVKSAEGKVIGISKIARDITGRRLDEEKIRLQSAVVRGINEIFEAALAAVSEERLGETCLAVAEKITGSRFGFVGEIGIDGLLHDIAISNPGWEACRMHDRNGIPRPPGNFQVHGIYGRVLKDGKGFFTNLPSQHPDSIGLPPGHPPLEAFLGVPLINDGAVAGMIAVGNRPGGYRQEELDLLTSIAPAVMEAFLRKRAEKATQDLLDRQRKLLEASLMISSQAELEGALNAIAEAAISLTGGRYSVAGHGYLGGKFAAGGSARAGDAESCPQWNLFEVERGGVYLDLLDKAETLRLTDAEMRAHPAWWGLPAGHVPMRGLLAARLTDTAGRPRGVILITDKVNGCDFTGEDEATLKQLSVIGSLAIEHCEAAGEVLERVHELERFNAASVGRELRVIQIKKEVNELCGQAGLPPRYTKGLDEEEES
ncbi:PAS domain S-box protein [Geomonas sp. Red32]|nr:PAS domain S-box protein [Geomonas sp. Red32]